MKLVTFSITALNIRKLSTMRVNCPPAIKSLGFDINKFESLIFLVNSYLSQD